MSIFIFDSSRPIPIVTQKPLETSPDILEAASKIDNTSVVLTADERRPKRNVNAVREGYKVAAISSSSKEGIVSVKDESKIKKTASVATVNDNHRVCRQGLFSLYNKKYPFLICF